MNNLKLGKLFDAARAEKAPAPDLLDGVMRAIHLEPHPERNAAPSLLDSIAALFPRAALASALVILVCAAADFIASPPESMGLSADLARFSEQWPFIEQEF